MELWDSTNLTLTELLQERVCSMMLSDKLKLSATGIYTSSTKTTCPKGGIGSVLYGALNSDPITTPRDEENGSGYGETHQFS